MNKSKGNNKLNENNYQPCMRNFHVVDILGFFAQHIVP